MPKLASISGIGKTSLELLEAAGFLDVDALAKAGAEELTAELERANRMLAIAKRAPTRKDVDQWIRSARESIGLPTEKNPATPSQAPVTSNGTSMPVNYEGSPDVAKMLAAAPFAIPLPARQLMEHRVAVAEIPPAILLNRYSGDLEVRVEDRPLPVNHTPQAPRTQRPSANHYVQVADAAPPRLEIDVSKLKTTEDRISQPRLPSAPRPPQDDRVALIRTTREETNRGRDPKSRRYIRGVLHTHPISVSLGAFITLILMALLPTAIISALLLLLSDLSPENFYWVPKWLLAFPLALPVVGLAWLIWGVSSSCRICGQKLFMPRACRKNIKAHHIPGLGHIIPLSLHLLFFRWFRCTFCGTPVRLKK